MADRWEYLDLPFARMRKYDPDPRRLIDYDANGHMVLISLTDCGANGWELVACTDSYATFKRRISEGGTGDGNEGRAIQVP